MKRMRTTLGRHVPLPVLLSLRAHRLRDALPGTDSANQAPEKSDNQ